MRVMRCYVIDSEVRLSSVLGSSSTCEQPGTIVTVSWRDVGNGNIKMTKQCHSKRKSTLSNRSECLLEYKNDAWNATEDLVI
jgi:hypothetical protein